MLPAKLSHLRRLLALSVSLSFATILAGCGIGAADLTTSGSLSLQGVVHGGQQPVAGATIHLYSAGTTGIASPATDMLNVTTSNGVVHYVTSDSGGNFSITGDYSCAHSTDQVYIVATGGNPGLPNNGTNPALVMVDTLGSCGTLLANAATGYITINEVTTVAAAWALAPFMTSATNVGATSTNSLGIANAFLDAQLLASSSTGAVPTNLPSNLSTETGKLYAFADAIAGCVNSNGGIACTPLFTAATPTGGTAPTNTLAAALNIVKNPGQHVAAVFQSIPLQPPFYTALMSPPSDWTMSLTITGGGLYEPSQLQLDTLGNVWVADYQGIGSNIGAVSAFTPQGTPISPATGFTTPSLSEVLGLTVDTNNNVWATSEEVPGHGTTAGSVSVFYGASASQPVGTYALTVDDPSINFPETLASDTNGNVLIGNEPSGSVTIYTGNGGGLVGANLGLGHGSFISAVTADGSHGFWMANQGDGPNGTVTHIDASGNFLARPVCCNGSNGIARDVSGNIWVSSYYGAETNGIETTSGSLSELSSTGTVLLNQTVTGGGVYRPAALSLDASQNVWVVNFRAQSFSEIAGSAGTLAAGTPISPSTGYGLDIDLTLPFSIVPDASGNIWISSFGNNDLVMFFGLATPTATPAGPAPLAP